MEQVRIVSSSNFVARRAKEMFHIKQKIHTPTGTSTSSVIHHILLRPQEIASAILMHTKNQENFRLYNLLYAHTYTHQSMSTSYTHPPPHMMTQPLPIASKLLMSDFGCYRQLPTNSQTHTYTRTHTHTHAHTHTHTHTTTITT